MTMFTSRFANKELRNRPDLVKVAIAVGSPRWCVGYDWVKCRCLAPYGLRKLKGEEFRAAYLSKLHRHGFDAIRDDLETISQQHGGKDLVLLCYEDLRKPGEWCHRAIFADWWLQWTGELVLELETELGPPRPEQMGLC